MSPYSTTTTEDQRSIAADLTKVLRLKAWLGSCTLGSFSIMLPYTRYRP